MKSSIKQFVLTLMLVFIWMGVVQAETAPSGTLVTAMGTVEGGTNTTFSWKVPSVSTYRVYIHVPSGGTATNALYQVRPKGSLPGSDVCSSTDKNYPCIQIALDQSLHQNEWIQLTLNNKPTTQWKFTATGFVSVNASNLNSSEMLKVAEVVFQDMGLKIGQTYQGGIIFYLDATRQHGLVAAPSAQSSGMKWYNGGYTLTDVTAVTIGTGQFNTSKIVSKQGLGVYAAWLCDSLVIGQYSDWFLPSKEELYLMYLTIGQGAAAPLTNIGGFADAEYWSSSEDDSYDAWSQDFSDGSQISYNGKNELLIVRAIRAF
jgi:hypothetical protein